MRVLLGEVEGAVVAYNGEPYDLSRYQGRSVVHFTVGELSSTTAPEPPAPTAEPLTRETREPTTGDGEQAVANARELIIVPHSRDRLQPLAKRCRKPPRPKPAASVPAGVLSDRRPDS